MAYGSLIIMYKSKEARTYDEYQRYSVDYEQRDWPFATLPAVTVLGSSIL